MSNDDKWPRVDYKFVNNSVRVKRVHRHDDTRGLRPQDIFLVAMIVCQLIVVALWILSKVTP